MKEAQNIEWKQSWRDECLRWICGFANAEGGTLAIGKNDREWLHVSGISQAISVAPFDATGAGDCFDGSLLARLAAGDALAGAVRYANVSAALLTLGHGAVAPIPHAAAVLARLARER